MERYIKTLTLFVRALLNVASARTRRYIIKTYQPVEGCVDYIDTIAKNADISVNFVEEANKIIGTLFNICSSNSMAVITSEGICNISDYNGPQSFNEFLKLNKVFLNTQALHSAKPVFHFPVVDGLDSVHPDEFNQFFINFNDGQKDEQKISVSSLVRSNGTTLANLAAVKMGTEMVLTSLGGKEVSEYAVFLMDVCLPIDSEFGYQIPDPVEREVCKWLVGI